MKKRKEIDTTGEDGVGGVNQNPNHRERDWKADSIPLLELLDEKLSFAGAVKWGISEAQPVDKGEWMFFESWLKKGYNAGMDYMERHLEIRRDPRLLLNGAKSIISIAFNYRQFNPMRGVATYALGKDYHTVLRNRLKSVVGAVRAVAGGEWRICVDSAPVLERYWAVKSGVGKRSHLHGNVVVDGVGSMVFLAEIITDIKLPPTHFTPPLYIDEKVVAENICPSGALLANGVIDCRKCLNYLTIEHKGKMNPLQANIMSRAKRKGVIFGCDICQISCDYNRNEPVSVLEEFRPLDMLEDAVDALSKEDRDKVPTYSPLYRALKRKGN